MVDNSNMLAVDSSLWWQIDFFTSTFLHQILNIIALSREIFLSEQMQYYSFIGVQNMAAILNLQYESLKQGISKYFYFKHIQNYHMEGIDDDPDMIKHI